MSCQKIETLEGVTNHYIKPFGRHDKITQEMTPIVRQLLLINVGLFVAQSWLGLDLIRSLGLRYVFASSFHPYQFLTHLFVHASFNHLVGNMLSLLTFGPILERTLTPKRFLGFYLFTGIGAAAFYAGTQCFTIGRLEALYHTYLVQPNPTSFVTFLNHFPHHTYNSFYSFITAFFEHPDNPTYLAKSKAIISQLYTLKAEMPTVGASGAVFGILTAFAMLFPNTALFLHFIPIPIRAKYMIVIYGIHELYAGIRANPTDNVAHFAHLGGILLAYFFIRWWRKRYYR